jgi:hypothetical protein
MLDRKRRDAGWYLAPEPLCCDDSVSSGRTLNLLTYDFAAIIAQHDSSRIEVLITHIPHFHSSSGFHRFHHGRPLVRWCAVFLKSRAMKGLIVSAHGRAALPTTDESQSGSISGVYSF